MPLTPRHLRRYRQIAEILTRHGFGAVLAQLELERHLDLPRRLLRLEPAPEPVPAEDPLTPAKHVRLALEELGPTFIKFGQILSTRPDLLPPAYIDELSRLQDDVPPAPWSAIEPFLEAELGGPIEQFFPTLDPTPMAAASLAQVHPATLPNGEQVVVKIQRPHIGVTINLDLDILYDLARLAQERTPLGELYDLVELAEDFAVSLRAELDYRREGRNAERFQENFAGEEKIYIPRVHWDCTTRRVLVQERIDGIKINEIAALEAAGYDCQQLALHSARFIVQEVLEDGFFHADPHPGNVVVLPDEVIGLMDFGMVGYLTNQDRTNLVRLYIVAVRLDTAGIVEQLVRLGIAEQGLDRAALERDVRRLMLKYHGLPLQDIRVGDVLEEIRPIVYRHRLRLSSDLWLLGKTLVMMEGVGLKLDPTFDMFAVSEPHVRRFMRRMWLPSEWGPVAMRNIANLADLMVDFPHRTSRLMDQVERGGLAIDIHLPELEETTDRVDGIANRIILAVLLAAFIVALAMLIPILNLTWPWGLLTWIIIVIFAMMSILALWLIISILRSGGAR